MSSIEKCKCKGETMRSLSRHKEKLLNPSMVLFFFKIIFSTCLSLNCIKIIFGWHGKTKIFIIHLNLCQVLSRRLVMNEKYVGQCVVCRAGKVRDRMGKSMHIFNLIFLPRFRVYLHMEIPKFSLSWNCVYWEPTFQLLNFKTTYNLRGHFSKCII